MVAGSSNSNVASSSGSCQHEDAVRSSVRAAAKATLAVPSQKQWVVEFLVESILADVMDEQASSSGAKPAPAPPVLAHGSSKHIATARSTAGSMEVAGMAGNKNKPAGQGPWTTTAAHTTSQAVTAEQAGSSKQDEVEYTVRILLSKLPADAAEAEERFGGLLYDSLDDVGGQGVAMACACVTYEC
jgi:hypothetical protein